MRSDWLWFHGSRRLTVVCAAAVFAAAGLSVGYSEWIFWGLRVLGFGVGVLAIFAALAAMFWPGSSRHARRSK